MAIGYRGVDGRGELGVWGPLLFSIPLLGAWYSFERLDSISRTYRQTIEALAMAPELGGVVRAGPRDTGRRRSRRRSGASSISTTPTSTTSRRRRSCTTSGRSRSTSPRPEHAPTSRGRGGDRRDAAGDRAVADAAEIVAGEPLGTDAMRHPSTRVTRAVALASQALKVASAFDDLTEGESTVPQPRSRRCTRAPATSTTHERSRRSSASSIAPVGCDGLTPTSPRPIRCDRLAAMSRRGCVRRRRTGAGAATEVPTPTRSRRVVRTSATSVGCRGRARAVGACAGWPRRSTSKRPTAMMRSPKRDRPRRTVRSTMMSVEPEQVSSGVCGWCFTVVSTMLLAPVGRDVAPACPG